MPFVAFIESSGGGGPAPVGLVWYEHETLYPSFAIPPAAAAVKASFLSHLSVSGAEDFESYEPGRTFTSESVTINGVGVTFSDARVSGFFVEDFIEGIDDPQVNGRWSTTSPGTPPTCRWLEFGGTGSQTLTMTFSTPISSLAFWGTDFGDFSGRVSMTLHKSGGGTVSHDIGHSVPSTEANLMFVGFDDDTDTYTQVDIYISSPSEAVGLDDLIVATAAQRA